MKIFGDREYIYAEETKNEDGKVGKYLEKCIIYSLEGVTGCWRGWFLQMIICKRSAPPDDHLQEAGPSG